MPLSSGSGRAVRYACSVLADCRVGSLPADPFVLAAAAGITMLPLSAVQDHPLWVSFDVASALRMKSAVTLSYPAFCIVYRDGDTDPDRLRFALFHELGHLFLNHYRDYPDQLGFSGTGNSALESEADSFALNLMAPVPVVDVIRFNRPRQARASLFGLSRSAWMRRLDTMNRDRAFITEEMANLVLFLFRDYLLGRRCPACGQSFLDEQQENRCPFCGAPDPDWTL